MVFSSSLRRKVLAKMKSFQMKIALTITTVTTVFHDIGSVIRAKIR